MIGRDHTSLDGASGDAPSWYDMLVGAPTTEDREQYAQLAVSSYLDSAGTDAITGWHIANGLRFTGGQYDPERALETIEYVNTTLGQGTAGVYIRGHYRDVTQLSNQQTPVATPTMEPSFETTCPVVVRTEGEMSFTSVAQFDELHVVVAVDEQRKPDRIDTGPDE